MLRLKSASICAVIGLSATLMSMPAEGAQETRDAQLAAEQADKASRLHPYEPTVAERRVLAIEELLVPRQFTAFVGSIYPGSLLAAGPRYRLRFSGSGRFDVHGAWSLKNYKLAETSLRLPPLADGRLRIEMGVKWIDAPKVDFYGTGNESRLDRNTKYLYRSTTTGASARVQPVRFVTVGGGFDYLDVHSGAGSGGTSIEQFFGPADPPGLGASPAYTRSRLFAEFDRRQSPGYTRSGGFYRIDWSDYRQKADGPYSFRQIDAEVAQFVPLLRENLVLAFRGLLSTTDTDPAKDVPYFLMPDLGGSSELRGYPSWRFRDRHRLLLTGEYRWMAGQFVDMALFLDAGKVTPRRSDLNFDDLKGSFGIGARFHTSEATVMRIEIARTFTEGTGLLLSFSQIF